MQKKSVFRMPKTVSIMARSSSITNAFVNGLIPVVKPTEEEIKEALSILGMTEETICCAYCGDACTEWDHLRPLITDKEATGFISEIHNLVPACGKCNQSKGNSNWKEWMYGNANGSPKSRGILDIDERAGRIEQYENWWGNAEQIKFEEIVDEEKWKRHWENYGKIIELMKESQILQNEIKKEIKEYYQKHKG